MDARIRDFIKRTKQAIGLPSKFGRQQSALLTSSSGHSGRSGRLGPHCNGETLVESPIPLRPSDDPVRNSVSILEEERFVRPRLPPTAQDFPEPQKFVKNTGETLQDGVQFKDSPCRIIVHNEGSATFYALLLNEDLVEKQREILDYCRKRKQSKEKLRAVKVEVIDIENKIKDTKELIEDTSNDKRSTTLEKDLDLQQQRCASICQKRDALQWDLDMLEINLEYLRNLSQSIFEDVLREANMLNLPEPDDNSNTSDQDQPEHGQPSGTISVRSSSTSISMEHTFRLALAEEMERKRMAFDIMRDAFDRRDDDLGKEFEVYKQAVQDGTCDLPQTDFDRWGVEMLQTRTGDYIDAEIAYEEVKTRARALGLLDNEYDQESNFIDYADDGYHESFEAGMVATVPADFIESWKAEIIDSQDTESLNEEQLEADDWEAKTIGLSDSVSLVDRTRNGARIDRWQEICRLTREREREGEEEGEEEEEEGEGEGKGEEEGEGEGYGEGEEET